jgi:hypothetical protein
VKAVRGKVAGRHHRMSIVSRVWYGFTLRYALSSVLCPSQVSSRGLRGVWAWFCFLRVHVVLFRSAVSGLAACATPRPAAPRAPVPRPASARRGERGACGCACGAERTERGAECGGVPWRAGDSWLPSRGELRAGSGACAVLFAS